MKNLELKLSWKRTNRRSFTSYGVICQLSYVAGDILIRNYKVFIKFKQTKLKTVIFYITYSRDGARHDWWPKFIDLAFGW